MGAISNPCGFQGGGNHETNEPRDQGVEGPNKSFKKQHFERQYFESKTICLKKQKSKGTILKCKL